MYLEDIKAEVMSDLTKLEDKLSTDKTGVLVQASTLGALEALLQFLREETKPPIPVSAIGIGTVHKRDVTKTDIADPTNIAILKMSTALLLLLFLLLLIMIDVGVDDFNI